MTKIKTAIIGGAGYTAGELLRLLVNHPSVQLCAVQSTSHAGQPVASVHAGLAGDTDLVFSENIGLDGLDALFLCQGHGASSAFWQSTARPAGLKVIDLAQDFRDESNGYVYGLPEINAARISGADSVANPGCFATAIQLSLLPVAAAGLLPRGGDINVTAVTGSTGAGVKPSATTHFSWRNDNLSVYKPFTHQHLAEINRTLQALQPGHGATIGFVPVRGDFARGIFAMTQLPCSLETKTVRTLFNSFYAQSPFVTVMPGEICLKDAVNTNKAVIGLHMHNGHLLVTCAIDNLLKGASGQAVQNLNLMFGLDQTTGLRLKASAF